MQQRTTTRIIPNSTLINNIQQFLPKIAIANDQLQVENTSKLIDEFVVEKIVQTSDDEAETSDDDSSVEDDDDQSKVTTSTVEIDVTLLKNDNIDDDDDEDEKLPAGWCSSKSAMIEELS